jgi:hypothetical protein
LGCAWPCFISDLNRYLIEKVVGPTELESVTSTVSR